MLCNLLKGIRLMVKKERRNSIDFFWLLFLAGSFFLAWHSKPAKVDYQQVSFLSTELPLHFAEGQNPIYVERLASRNLDAFVHSPALVALQNGDLLSAWFSGEREGAKDVVIRSARFDETLMRWGEDLVIVTREQTRDGTKRYIRKLGNPSLGQGPDGRVWLFYVSVTQGGWSQSGVNMATSSDNGKTWSKPKRLMTTPFWNVSNLVRSPPIFLANNYVGLPLYHEMLGKFSEYLILDSEGQVLDKVRMGVGGRVAIQPAVVTLTQQKAVSLFRYSGKSNKKLYGGFTDNAGLTWTSPVELTPDNPNSSVAATTTGIQEWPILVAQNDQQRGRFRMSLYVARSDLSEWRRIFVLDASPHINGALIPIEEFRPLIRGQYISMSDEVQRGLRDKALDRITLQMCRDGKTCDFDFEYPSMVNSPTGLTHLVYAWNDTLIKHVSFNSKWLSERIQETQKGASLANH